MIFNWKKWLKGLFMEARVLPFVNWFLAACILGTSLAYLELGYIHWGKLAFALLLGFVIQSFPTHSINEIVDWKSGTDQARGITGGSKVIKYGIFSIVDLWRLFFGSTLLVIVLLIVSLIFNPVMIVILGFIGLSLGIAYTAPPFKMAYRPFMGEYFIAFPAMTLAVLGCFWIHLDKFMFSPFALGCSLAFAFSCVAIMMCYHTIDFQNDLAANKRTSIVFLGPENGQGLVVVNSAIALLLYFVIGCVINPLILFLAIGNFGCLWYYNEYDPWNDLSIIASVKQVGKWHIGSLCVLAVFVNPWFGFFTGIVLIAYWSHYRFGKVKRRK